MEGVAVGEEAVVLVVLVDEVAVDVVDVDVAVDDVDEGIGVAASFSFAAASFAALAVFSAASSRSIVAASLSNPRRRRMSVRWTDCARWMHIRRKVGCSRAWALIAFCGGYGQRGGYEEGSWRDKRQLALRRF